MSNLKVSIAMAAYNGEKYLNEQLESFIRQTVLPYELVVCDDSSNDSTIDILNNFKFKAPFMVTILRNEVNQGSTRSFQRALEQTSGDWVCLSDQDDVWKENKIEEYLKVIENSDSKVGLIYCDHQVVDEKLNYIQNIDSKFISDYKNPEITSKNADIFLFKNETLPGCAMIIKRKGLEKYFPITTKYHDSWLAFAISLDYSIKYINKKLFLYRLHCNQQVGYGNFGKTTNQKTFYQKFFYDFSKIERRKESRLKDIEKNIVFSKTALKFLEDNKYQKKELHNLCSRRLFFYTSRLKAFYKKRIFRLFVLVPLLFKGLYKEWEPKRYFSEFRRDIEMPMIKDS